MDDRYRRFDEDEPSIFDRFTEAACDAIIILAYVPLYVVNWILERWK